MISTRQQQPSDFERLFLLIALCIRSFFRLDLSRGSEQQATPMVESSSQLDTATIDVRDWQQLVELGSGRTGTVTLCVEPPDTNSSRTPKTATATYGQDHRICHAIKLVKRQCVTSGGGARRLLRERDALKALKGVRKIRCRGAF